MESIAKHVKSQICGVLEYIIRILFGANHRTVCNSLFSTPRARALPMRHPGEAAQTAQRVEHLTGGFSGRRPGKHKSMIWLWVQDTLVELLECLSLHGGPGFDY